MIKCKKKKINYWDVNEYIAGLLLELADRVFFIGSLTVPIHWKTRERKFHVYVTQPNMLNSIN